MSIGLQDTNNGGTVDSLYTTGSGTVPAASVANLTDILTFLGGKVIFKGSGTEGNSVLIIQDDGTLGDLWDFLDDGNIVFSKTTQSFNDGTNDVLKLGELFTGSATDGLINFQIGTDHYPINIYSNTAVNDGAYRMRIGTVSNTPTILGNAFLTLSAQSGAELLLQNSAGRMIFQSGGAQQFVVRLNNNSYMPLSAGRGFGVGLTAPESKLHVKGDGTEPVFIAETSGNVNTFKVLEDGSIIQGALTSEPNDADLVNNSISFWINSGVVTAKHKDIGGKTANYALYNPLSAVEGSATILEASWNGTTNYPYSISVSGAVKGDTFDVYLDDDVMAAIKTASAENNSYAYCNVDGTVEVVGRVTTFITIPASSTIKVKCVK